MTQFWSNWLLVWCWGVLAFGALLVTAAIPGLDGAARMLFGLFAPNPATAFTFDLPAVRFGLGLQGALTIGWAMTMFAVLHAAKTVGAPIWRSLTFALLAWYVIDSAISVSTGFWLNAVSNTALIVTYLIPVLASSALRAK
ncbi:MAG: hypothetical protein ABL871_07620 [Terricaulis sp.]